MQNPRMANTYLNVDFKEKDAAKALGARWDGAARQWYVPDGRELTPFAQWMPVGASSPDVAVSRELTPVSATESDLALPTKQGVSLSSLLAGVSQAVAQVYKTGVWVLVEVVELRTNGGHVFMGVSERDTAGMVLAKSSAVIWQSTANTILPEFERATGVQLAPGIKLLVRARPVFKPLHGFSIEIDAIDPEYTLGDLEARKREIRERLQGEGVYAANKQLPAPWDFNAVLVVAPEGGAGLGDFQAEANRLAEFGICHFVYAYSRFQGEGAAKEVCDALQAAIAGWSTDISPQPDAVVIIRGGGAVNDMAWLNDYDLTRYICDLSVPVFTGIGHERDSTVLDEVAHTKFDTPSKVIAGIEQVIVKRANEAKANFEQLTNRITRQMQSVKLNVAALDVAVRSEANRHLAQGRQSITGLITDIRVGSMQEVRSASEQSRDAVQSVKTQALAQLSAAKQEVPMYWSQIAQATKHAASTKAANAQALVDHVIERARRDVAQAKDASDDALVMIASAARLQVRGAVVRSDALMREITGQGPEKTLRRGFALVRDPSGQAISRAAQLPIGSAIDIQFNDGTVSAVTKNNF